MMREQQAAAEAPASLWRNGAFLRLWFAQIVSNAGSAITGYALPLTAILVLGAGPVQMAFLRGADFVPHLIFGLFAGVWVDRARRQPILIGADLGRALLLATIPLATLLGVVSFPQLWLVVFAVSTLTACSSLAAVSLLPKIVPPRQLVAANSRLATTDAVLAVTMPSAASGIVQLLGAPRAIFADVLSYLASAFTLRRLRAAETANTARLTRTIVVREIAEGLRELIRTPVLRILTISVSVGTFGTAMQSTVSFLFLLDELHLTPLLIGILGTCGGAGGLVGAAYAERVSRHLGIGPALIIGNLCWGIGALVAPIVPRQETLILLGVGAFVASAGGAIWGVTQMSLRQAITPSGLFARATAARRLPMFGMQLLGAALGGYLGITIGLRLTLLLGAGALIASALILLASPIRTMSTLTSAPVE
jgi:MFS family permease